MTTDAKIGLLLALVFIVAITFVINGLPDFLSKKDKADVTDNYINHYNKSDEPGIVDRSSREAATALNKKIVSIPAPAAIEEVNAQLQQQKAAYQAILPAASEVVKSAANTPLQQTEVIANPALPAASRSAETIYEVADGDSLAGIALKYYGPQAGKKLVNIRKIYEANKKTLKSIDDLQVGQKLVIPSLGEKEQALINTGLFEKTDGKTKTTSAGSVKESKSTASPQEYVIKEQDTLWKIAAKFLGDGSRYEEIAALNTSIDPDNLVVGTKIKLPAK